MPSKRRTTQYFDMFGNRAIYHDGWIAATTPPAPPWLLGTGTLPALEPDYKWELYNIAEGFFRRTTTSRRATPAKLAEMQKLFLSEAAKYNVLPARQLGLCAPAYRPGRALPRA